LKGASPLLLIGKELRGIKILSKLGAGGMGAVYLGRVLRQMRGLTPGMEVSVKVLHSHLSRNPKSVARFKMEAGLGLTLRHPNIVKIFHVGTEKVDGEQVHFLVQEYFRGDTLKTLIANVKNLSDPFLRKIAAQIAEALSQIHEKGIIHRDLKPENVFLEEDGQIKLVDFGFSYKVRSLENRDSDPGFFGTVSYAAPERFGPSNAGMASDIYSFGVILYELATGVNPFLTGDLDTTVNNHIDLTPEAPSRKNPHISSFVNQFIMATLEKAPERRLGPSYRLTRILKKGETSRWWKSLHPDENPYSISIRRRLLKVSRRTSVFGRDRERDILLELMNDVTENKDCRAVCLFGEAGSGKTRLVDHFLETIEKASTKYNFVFMECGQGAVKIPYFPLISALQNVFSLNSIDRTELRPALTKELNKVLPLRTGEIDLFTRFLISGKLEPDCEIDYNSHQLTVGITSRLLSSMAEEAPLLLLIENVGEADPPTFHLISRMLYQISNSRILMIATARPGETIADDPALIDSIDPLLSAMDETVGMKKIELKRLDRTSVYKILHELGFPRNAAFGTFGERVFSITEGNPYFAFEIARLVEYENRVAKGSVDWKGLAEEIPSSIQDAFYRRLFRISPEERRFLDFASVIGMRFKQAEVVQGLKLDFNAAAQTISSLQNRSLIRPVSSGFLRFDHVLIRDLLYRSMAPEDRMSYHLRIGENYAALADVRELTGRDCYKACVHFSRGNNSKRALDFFQNAFDYLQYKHFHGRAHQLANRAVSHISELSELGNAPDASFICSVYLKLSEASGILGSRKVQFEALKEALLIVKECDDPELIALVRLRIGQYCYTTSRYLSALSFTESALIWMEKSNNLSGKADALQTIGLILKEVSGRNDEERILDNLQHSLSIRRELKDDAGQAGVLVDMGEYYLGQGDLSLAENHLETAINLFRSIRNERGMASVLLILAKVEIVREAPAKAERFLKEAGRIAHEVGDAAMEADVYGAAGVCSMMVSDFAKAKVQLKRSHKIAYRIRDIVRQTRILKAQVRFLVHTENPEPDLDEALKKAREAIDLSKSINLNAMERVDAMNTLALVYIKLDKPASAYAITWKILRILDGEEGMEQIKVGVKQRFDHLAVALKKRKRNLFTRKIRKN